MRPADINIPQNIKTVALINRTLPINNNYNILEGILTTELPGQDKRGAEEALNGLNQRLMQSPRFQIKMTNVKLQGSGSGGSFPEPLPWDRVDSIAQAYGADAVVSLETYDSDVILTNYSKPVQKKKDDGSTYTVTEYYVDQVALVKLGFRIYDHNAKSIPDQHHYSYRMKWTGRGKTPQEALLRLVEKRQAINRASYAAGENYCSRIAPSWFSAGRTYFKKPGADMKAAARKAQVNQWEKAAVIWEDLVATSISRKKAGRAAHNLALANEVLGNLEVAKNWAQQAYSDFNCKQSKNYVQVLENRIWDMERLKEQLGEDAGK